MRGGDTEALDTAELLVRPDFVTPPGPRSSRPDVRFTNVAVPGDRTVRVITRLDADDPWIARFVEMFRVGLTEPDSRYAVVAAEDGEIETIRAAVGLLGRLLPEVTSSVLSHLSFIGVVDGAGVFESASDRKVPRAIFISRAALTDVPRTAEAILHECVHQKLYDIQLVHSIYRPGYDAHSAAVIRPPWHENAAWSYDRALAAAHVYVHLAAFYTVLEQAAEPCVRYVDVDGGRQRTVERARFLLGAVVEAVAESGPAGRQFIDWLSRQLEYIEAARPTSAQPHTYKGE